MSDQTLRRSHLGLWRLTAIVAATHLVLAVELLVPGRHELPTWDVLQQLLGEMMLPLAVLHVALAAGHALTLSGASFSRAGLLRLAHTLSTGLFVAQGLAFAVAASRDEGSSFVLAVLSWMAAAVCTVAVSEPVAVTEVYDGRYSGQDGAGRS